MQRIHADGSGRRISKAKQMKMITNIRYAARRIHDHLFSALADGAVTQSAAQMAQAIPQSLPEIPMLTGRILQTC
jgi:hypothetical protein